jgi:hypothetical protein
MSGVKLVPLKQYAVVSKLFPAGSLKSNYQVIDGEVCFLLLIEVNDNSTFMHHH